MAVLGKDIFDLYRPHTHTKIQFGDKGYWVEWGTDCLPYGSILTEILNCNIAISVLHSYLKHAIYATYHVNIFRIQFRFSRS